MNTVTLRRVHTRDAEPPQREDITDVFRPVAANEGSSAGAPRDDSLTGSK